MTDRTYVVEYWTGSEDEKADLSVAVFATAEEALAFHEFAEGSIEDLVSEGFLNGTDIQFQTSVIKASREEVEEDPQNWVEWEEKGLIEHEDASSRLLEELAREERVEALDLRFHKVFVELVPPCGKAASVAGENIRAVGRIDYRYYNDGDEVGRGYGKETCSPSAKYLKRHGMTEDVRNNAKRLFTSGYDFHYEEKLADLVESVLDAVESNPEFKAEPNDIDSVCFGRKDA